MCCTSTSSLIVIVLCLCECMCVCAEEGSEEKINKEHLPLILCLAHFLCGNSSWSGFYYLVSLVLGRCFSSVLEKPASFQPVHHWQKCSVCWPYCGVFLPLQVNGPKGGETESLGNCLYVSSFYALWSTMLHPGGV